MTAAAVKLGLIGLNGLDAEETADLVELVWPASILEPAERLGQYLVRHWERRVASRASRSSTGCASSSSRRLARPSREGGPAGGRVGKGGPPSSPTAIRAAGAPCSTAPVPSWHELQFRR